MSETSQVVVRGLMHVGKEEPSEETLRKVRSQAADIIARDLSKPFDNSQPEPWPLSHTHTSAEEKNVDG